MSFTLAFSEIGRDSLPKVGGKGANLGVLASAGLPVPDGFCVTTDAYDRFLGKGASFTALDALDGGDVDAARKAAEAMRAELAKRPLPDDVAAEIVSAWRKLGDAPLAVRSSATAEDLPGASFAGQQDTYLNIRGEAALLDAVKCCWISLFTDRAVLYRARGKFGHESVKLGVVVQRLVEPDVAGIMFTADPISGKRTITSIDAGFGLGEALVSGVISADLYKVEQGKVLLAQPGDKPFAIRSLPSGGTERVPLPDTQRHGRALDDAQVLALAEMGARVQALYGSPQDIEWCLQAGEMFLVQARPITSLYPIPELPKPDEGTHVFLSFNHLQMMLDAMPRMACEVWSRFFPVPGILLPAGSRLFVDATGVLRVPRARAAVLSLLSVAYEMLGVAAKALIETEEFKRGVPRPGNVIRGVIRVLSPLIARLPLVLFVWNPVKRAKAFTNALDEIPKQAKQRIHAGRTPAERMRLAKNEMERVFSRVRHLLPNVLAGFLAHRLLLRITNNREEMDHLTRGLPGNVTTNMDLAVGDLTDHLREHGESVILDAAIASFLQRYGHRGAGEIDISRPRWRDDPSLLKRVMQGGVASAPGAHRRHHEALMAEGEAAAKRVTAAQPWPRRAFVRRLTQLARYGMGQREHPKFIIVQILGVIREEVLSAAAELVGKGLLDAPHDAWHLGFDELADAFEQSSDVRALVAERKAAFAHDRTRKPPIAMSSLGEIPSLVSIREDLPKGALPGTAASSGMVEGIAHVITDPDRESIQSGEILVAPFTDPGWTPLFVHAIGVVTEVGGLMTHGAVVAREYGIPAVVSVTSALEKIKTGQRIRVDGTRGYVLVLEDK